MVNEGDWVDVQGVIDIRSEKRDDGKYNTYHTYIAFEVTPCEFTERKNNAIDALSPDLSGGFDEDSIPF